MDAGSGEVLRRILDEILMPRSPFDAIGHAGLDLNESEGAAFSQVLREVRTSVVSHAVHPQHTWAMAHMVPPPLMISIVGDALIGALNQCPFIWEEAPVAADLERAVVRWLNERLGYGPSPHGLLTSGGTESNRLALFLALERAGMGPGAIRSGACIVATDQAHVSLEKAATLLGLAEDAVIRVPTSATGRLAPGLLDVAAGGALAEGRIPVMFVCTGGTTNCGVLEPIDEFLATAQAHGAWCHVDAAYGGFVRLLSQPPPITDSWCRADSISWDPHKTLHASLAGGALLVGEPIRADSLAFTADYATTAGVAPDPGLQRFDGSRRMEALKLWMCIRHLGRDGYAQLASRILWLAREMADQIRAATDLALVTEPDTSVLCFRYEPAECDPRACDQAMIETQATLFSDGGPLLSVTKLDGRVVFRAVLLNPELTPTDIHAILARVATVAGRALRSRERAGVMPPHVRA